MTKIVLYVHFNPCGEVSAHVMYQIQSIRKSFDRFIFISNSRLLEYDKRVISSLCDQVIERENIGFDFGAWKDAIRIIGLDAVSSFDQLVLMNDTCFGPVSDFENFISSSRMIEFDFWGISEHRAVDHLFRKSDGGAPAHLQSYFLLFNKIVVKSDSFIGFWQSVEYCDNVNDVIWKYETRLTQKLLIAGFRYGSYVNTTDPINFYLDYATRYPVYMLRNGSPFIKVKGFLYGEYTQYLKKMLTEDTDYNVDLIEKHFDNYYSPNDTIKVSNKNIIVNAQHCRIESNIRIAIHLHVHYIDVYRKYIKIMSSYTFPFRLFITTSVESYREDIKQIADEQHINISDDDIIVCKNKGRDVLPWLKLYHKISEYEIVGHFHTKKTAWSEEWIGESWQNEIFELLIYPAESIIDYFARNTRVGIIFADIPFCYMNNIENDTWGSNRLICKSLWERMGLRKKIDFSNLKSPVMPYGNMYWCRVKALKPLFELALEDGDFVDEPIPVDGTIAHAIERMTVYIAWAENYDYRIAINNNNIDSRILRKETYVPKKQERKDDIIVRIYYKIKRKLVNGIKRLIRIIR